MKIFILSDDMSGEGPVWMNIFWPHYNALSQCVPTVLLSPPYVERPASQLVNRWNLWKEGRDHGERLRQEVLSQLDPDGPNILLVWTLGSNDALRSRLLDPIWSLFSHRIMSILDTVDPGHISSDVVKRFDLITSFCGDLAADFEAAFGVPGLFFPPHTDVLHFNQPSAFRPLDLVVIGRRRKAIHDAIHLHFNQADQDRISVDFVTRTRNFSSTTENEMHLLMAGYSRAKATFCFEPSAGERFKGRSPLTERWVHAWTSGCTVLGTTPSGRGVAEQLDWPEATIDLPDTPEAAIEAVQDVLDDTHGLEQRRFRNIEEAARRHDTRHRLRTLLTTLDLPLPEALETGLARLDGLANEISELRQ